MQYEYLDHTADAKFKAYGASLEEAFVNAAYATFNIITDIKDVKKTLEFDIEIEAKRELSLLYDFIEELLILLDAEGFVLSEVKSLTIEGLKLKAKVVGDYFDNCEMHGNIKSITYSDMNIGKNEDGYVLTVVVDI
jgi:SHS2 domain-containing protein